MNYRLIYDNLISRGKTRELSGYKESHHIIPRCMGGSDDKDNLVDLTPEEHYIAHKLLCKINPNHYGLIKALVCMGMKSDSHNRHYNKSFGWARREFARLQTGEGNPFYGKHHSEEHKSRMREIMSGRDITWGDKISSTKQANPCKWTDEQKKLHSINQSGESNGMFGRKHTQESINKMKANRPSQSGGKNPFAKQITLDGITYSTMKEAAESKGISLYQLRKLLK